MPELPEVETVARQLRTVLINKKIDTINVLKAKSWQGDTQAVLHSPITEVSRRSKILRLHFANQQNIVVHLKMSGQLIYVDGAKRLGGGHPTADWIHELPSKHTRVQIHFEDGTDLFFNDQRMFGWLKVLDNEHVDQAYMNLAPDIIDPAITPEHLLSRAKNKTIPIKQFVMDNAIVAGVGNIYACDSLNLAKISPSRSTKTITAPEMKRLCAAMQQVVEKGIELGGATAHGEYVNVAGLAGKYQEVMRVYGRKGEPCLNCGTSIEKIKLGGRGTYFCPHCQV